MTHDDLLDPVQTTGKTDDVSAEEADSKQTKTKKSKDSDGDDKQKLILVKQSLEKVQNDLNRAFKILEGADTSFAKHSDFSRQASEIGKIIEEEGGKIIEGVFDGQNMIGPDGKQYSVPANYASKSKLIEGDILKLTIQPNGTFVYKQIGPCERNRLKGILVKDEETGSFQVLADGKKYKVILASVTYFKGDEGDEIIILVPKDKSSAWAAVENIIKKSPEQNISKNNSSDSNSDVPTTPGIDDIGL